MCRRDRWESNRAARLKSFIGFIVSNFHFRCDGAFPSFFYYFGSLCDFECASPIRPFLTTFGSSMLESSTDVGPKWGGAGGDFILCRCEGVL